MTEMTRGFSQFHLKTSQWVGQEMKSELPFFFPFFCVAAAECRAVGLYTSSGKGVGYN